MADAKYQVHLECSALGADALTVLRMAGHEEISQPFVFDVWVRPTQEPIFLEDFEDIIAGTATLSWGPDRQYPLHGVIRSVELMPSDDIDSLTYRMRLVPKIWDTQLTRGSWIYQNKTPREIISDALSQTLPEGARFADGSDFEFTLHGTYTPREYVVQYEESVLNFFSRQAEHWGIFYFFDHSGDHEKMILGDLNTVFPQLPGHESVDFVARAGIVDDNDVIYSLSAETRMVSHQVSLRDYNYRTPSVELVTQAAPIDAHGVGDVHVTGDHFWTPAEGGALAGVRAQELFMRKHRMVATGRMRGLRAGHRFTLQGGTPEILGLAREFVVVAVDHEFRTGSADGADPYRSRLTLIPYDVPFRPRRSTPKPHIYGVMHAKIDSEAADDGKHAPLDEWGRYKVVMPFDVAGRTGGQASCWIRVSSNSGGGGHGFSQQLHVGVEVAIFHVDGDPDRPVIAGALPNHEQPPQVTADNAHRAVFRMRGGTTMTFSD